MSKSVKSVFNIKIFSVATVAFLLLAGGICYRLTSAQAGVTLSASFKQKVMAPALPEAPFHLRFFITPVKTDSQGQIITGPTIDLVKNLVGAEFAGIRAGLPRYTKIQFGCDYIDGRPDPGTRIDPNNPIVTSGRQHWPFVPQPFRSWPNALAVTPDGKKLYVTLPGRPGYPDWRVAVVDTASRKVLRWIDLRPNGQSSATQPVGVQVSPLNTDIYPNPYAVVLNRFANFASVIDTTTDNIIGEFQTDFYAEDLVFNAQGTRLYTTDRFKDQVRAFRIGPGPVFTQIAEIPTGANDLDRCNPRDLSLSEDGKTLYVGNTLGHTIAVINVADDANTLVNNMPVGGLVTDVKIAGRWGIVAGHGTNSELNGPETGHGVPTRNQDGVVIRNNGKPLGYLPVMTDATRATTFDDIGSELNIFDTATNKFVFRYVDFERDLSLMAVPGEVVDLGDHEPAQEIIHGSGPEQIFVRGDLLFVAYLHSENVEVFRINQNPTDPSGILTPLGIELSGGITPQGVMASPDGKTVYIANMQTEDVSVLGVDAGGNLTRLGLITVGVTGSTPDPTTGGKGKNLFATKEEVGLRWLFSSAYSDDNQKSCGFCHWRSRSDGSAWNVGANAIGGVKVCPQNKDISDNWPEWFEGLNNDLMAYASACDGEVLIAERKTALFPQEDSEERLHARDAYVFQKTAENSAAIGHPALKGEAFSLGFYDVAYLQILWSQNETRLLPNPLKQFPSTDEESKVARGKFLFTTEVNQGGAGCASCHHNGNVITNGEVDDTFQDYNIHEPGVVAETTVGGDGPFTRLDNDYFFIKFGPPQDEGSRQNISSRNTKHLRAFWDSVPRWLHHSLANSVREILLPPDSPLLKSGERGFNFRTVRTDAARVTSSDCLGAPVPNLPVEVPITVADSSGNFAGDGKGPIYVSLDQPTSVEKPSAAYPERRLQVDRLGSDNLAPLIVLDDNGQRMINPELAANNIEVIKDTHGVTSHLSEEDIESLTMYLMSLQK